MERTADVFDLRRALAELLRVDRLAKSGDVYLLPSERDQLAADIEGAAQAVSRFVPMTYRNYRIDYRPKPIPSRACDWEYEADGFDGVPDSGDRRCGTASTLEAAKAAIDLLHEESEC